MPVDATPAKLSDENRRLLKSWLEEFGQSWKEGRLAGRVRQLPAAGDPLRLPALRGLVKIDLQRCWRQGTPANLEAYLQAYPELGTAESVALDLIQAEQEVRRQCGAPVDLAEFARRFPRRAEELQRRHEPARAAASPAPSAQATRETRSLPDTTPAKARSGNAPEKPFWVQLPPAATGSSAAVPASSDELPEQFGRYRILRRLGRGGMGSVYLAHDSQLDRQVALKVPHFHVDDGPEVLERFAREARSAATIEHPNICPVYDVGSINGIHYVTMAFIEGKPLSDLIASGKSLPQRAVAAVVRKLALALREAHARGIIHRDLKPANVMVNKRNEPVVMDFGLARRTNKDDVRLTKSGSVLGTPAYMSPEQVNSDAKAIGPGSDVYSLGVILYELLTSQLPFQGSMAAVLGQILTQEPKPPTAVRPDIDPALEAITLKAMAKKVEDRYASMAELAQALKEYLQSEGGLVKPVKGTPAAKGPPAPKRASSALSSAAPTASSAAVRSSDEGLATQLLAKMVERLDAGTDSAAGARGRAEARRYRWWHPLAAACVFMLVGAVVIFVMNSGNRRDLDVNVVVRLEGLDKRVNDPTVVLILLDGNPISKEELKRAIPLKKGEHELVLKDASGNVIDAHKFAVRPADHDKAIQVAAVAEDPIPPPVPAAKDNGKDVSNPGVADKAKAVGEWASLFNGKDLSGWTIFPEGTTGWEVKDGCIVSGGPVSQLFSTRSDYKNFHLHVEAMINDGGRSAQGFRAKFMPDIPYGYKAAINSTSREFSGLRTGSLYDVGSSSHDLVRIRDTLVKPDAWFAQEVIAEGNRFRVLVNGKEVVDHLDVGKTYNRGFFAIERLDQNTVLKVRKVEVKELPPPRPIVRAGAEKGWTQLFNGKDLSGWKRYPTGTTGWEVKDGAIVSSGPVSQLFSERGDYENFHFRVEARINHLGVSGQGFRAKFMPDTPYGYKAAINSTKGYTARTGALYDVGNSSHELERMRDTLVKPHVWFTQEVIAQGNHLIVKLDGETTVDLIDTDNRYRTGHLTLERADRDTQVQFRVIEIKELPPSTVVGKVGTLPVQDQITWDTTAWEKQFAVGARSHDPDKGESSWLLTAKQDAYVGTPETDYWGSFFDADNVELRRLQVRFTPKGKVKQGVVVRATLPHRNFGEDFFKRSRKVVVAVKEGNLPAQNQITWDTTAWEKQFAVGARSHDPDTGEFSWLLTAKRDTYAGAPEADYWGKFFDADNVKLRELQVRFTPRGKVKQGVVVRATLPHVSFGDDFFKRSKKVVVARKD